MEALWHLPFVKVKAKVLLTVLWAILVCTHTIAQNRDNSLSGNKTASEKPLLPLKDRLFWGGGLGVQFGRTTLLNVSPLLGYKATENFSVGVGGTYQFLSVNDGTQRYSKSISGGRVFGMYTIIPQAFAYGEYEMLQGDWQGNNKPFWVESVLAGGGIRQSFSGRSSCYILILWNFAQNTYTPYTNPVIRIGFNFGI